MTINGKLDTRFSVATEPVDWQQVSEALAGAELYWLTTVRHDGRPHTTPLVGAWVDDGFVFCTGPEEQKARNLAHGTAVTVTTGVNTWNDGLDVVVEGNAERLTGLDTLTPLADRIREKYDGEWDFTPNDNGFGHGPHIAYVFRVAPLKVLAFAKSPHGQTRFTL
ncbi:pyridoxamine-phosphate oxidase [Mycobacterium sp. JS623]|uniref:pyridoxamine 5'-phosphate oxidase family protein n=1 Tax=Mycobacterium sp. JS623 TaxID=212767 RepID=UPI0002A59684|nr:pyridoxamine 5'-phosphate oxidase family protein [Mycobacterium sp. JS623]AGB21107.1 pyridoxamine-phosphate oxidase [Mycobacterium sp. JS623]